MTLRLERVDTPARRADFQRLKQTVYATDPFYIPSADPVPTEGTLLLAYDDDTPVARCCARLQTSCPTTGTIGAFEALNHPEAVQALLKRAVDLLKAQGAQRIIGPMDGDTWHTYRFNTGPFDAAPFIKEPWNPSYYPPLWESAGFSVAETYDSFIIDDPALAVANQTKYLERCKRNGYTFTTITTANYTELLPLVYELSCKIFSQNVLYTPIYAEAYTLLYKPARSLLRTGLCWLAFSPDRTPAGFVFTFPDYAEAMRAMGGRQDLFAKLRFLMNKGKATRTCIKTLGVIPEARGCGLANALMCLSFENSLRLGYHQSLMCLMHSANASRRLGGKADRPFRTYALYEFTS